MPQKIEVEVITYMTKDQKLFDHKSDAEFHEKHNLDADTIHSYDIKKFQNAWENRTCFPTHSMNTSTVIFNNFMTPPTLRRIFTDQGFLDACMDILEHDMGDILENSYDCKEDNINLRNHIIKTKNKRAAYGFLSTVDFYDGDTIWTSCLQIEHRENIIIYS